MSAACGGWSWGDPPAPFPARRAAFATRFFGALLAGRRIVFFAAGFGPPVVRMDLLLAIDASGQLPRAWFGTDS